MDKEMNKPLKTIMCLLLLSLNSFALNVSEEKLIEWARSESFNAKKLELEKLNSQYNYNAFEDKFQASVQVKYNYLKTKETSFSSFAPITSPIKEAQVILSKPTMYGVQGSVSAGTSQVSNNFYQSGTTAKFGAAVAIDLYKDLFGKTTRANQDSLLIKKEIAKKESEITTHAYIGQVRKLYWSLVANNESLKIARELLDTSKKLEKDTFDRFKNNVADKGELSRTRSQVEARNGQILLLEFERSELFKRLKEMFPNKLGSENVSLSSYNLDNTIAEVLACSANISSKADAPKEYTKYDEVLALLKQDLRLSKKINESYSKADLKLVSELNYIGKDFSHSDAIDELKDSGRQQYAVGFQLDIPLGNAKKATEEIRDEIIQKSKISRYQEVEGKLAALHSQTVNSINVLYKVIAAQKRNSILLDETLKSSKKKFKQARLSSRELIQDEDSLLQSNLNEINTKYNVISTLIDYFSVFTETPCSINK